MSCMKSKVAKMDLQVACQVFKIFPSLFNEHLHDLAENCLLELKSLPNLDDEIIENSFNKNISTIAKQISKHRPLKLQAENILDGMLICTDKQNLNSPVHILIAVFVECFYKQMNCSL